MKYFLILLSFTALSFTNSTPDCRNSRFGDSPSEVRRSESAQFVKEELLLHNLKGLTFTEITNDAIILYTYTFHLEKLNGLKIKKVSRKGDNSYLNAYSNYVEALSRYRSNCDIRIKEKIEEEGLRSFKATSNRTKVYVMMQKESQDIFLVENIFKK